MTVDLPRSLQTLVRLVACLAALALASCGGGVSAPTSPVVNNPAITLLPGSGTILYSGLPTTFILSGGTGAYIVTSSDQAIIPIAGGVTGGSVTVVPNPVSAETTITLTARDTGTATPVTATVTVRPGTVANSITITPTASQDISCNPALCSGAEAQVTVTISQGGIPLAARGVRFDVTSGAFNFIVTPPGTTGEVLATSTTTATDERGVARARIRVTALAPNQTALLTVTDLGSGAFQRTSFTIAQYTGNATAFFTVPTGIGFIGPFANVCASNTSADITIFGGNPPYTISGGLNGVSASPTTVTSSGGKFQIILGPNAPCVSEDAPLPFAVTDAAGRTIRVTYSNKPGTGTAPPSAIQVFPNALTLACSFGTTAVTSSVSIVGGDSGATFTASSDHPRVTAVPTGRTVTLQRLAADNGPYATSARITVTDGITAAVVSASVLAFCP